MSVTVKWLREQLAELNDDAVVTVSINGCLFDVNGLGAENERHPDLPRVAILPGGAYSYSPITRSP